MYWFGSAFPDGLAIFGLIALPFLLFAILKRTAVPMILIVVGIVVLPVILVPYLVLGTCGIVRFLWYKMRGYHTVKRGNHEDYTLQKVVHGKVVDEKRRHVFYFIFNRIFPLETK